MKVRIIVENVILIKMSWSSYTVSHWNQKPSDGWAHWEWAVI